MRETRELNEVLTDIICDLWKVLKAADTKLDAYESAIKAVIETNHPEVAEALSGHVGLQIQSSALLQKMNEKYSGVLGTYLDKLPDDPPRTDRVLERLQKLEKLS